MNNTKSSAHKIFASCAAAAAVFVLLLVVIGIMCISTYNTQQTLLNQYEAKVSANKTELSNLKTKLPEAASVTDAQMRKLQELFVAHAEARKPEGGGSLMTWVQEVVPNVDQTTFVNLQNTVIASRDAWTRRQTELVDISRQYNTNLDTFPSGAILRMFGFERVEPQIVISEDTEKAFASGRDEKINLF